MSYLQDLFSNLLELFSNHFFLAGLAVILAFVSAIRMFPVIIHTVRTKNIMDEPDGRKVHSVKIPTLGGVGLFASFSLSLILFGIYIGLDRPDLIKLLSILGATLILLFLGMKDDLIAIAPKKKLAWQIVASGIVIFMTDVRILSFDGLLGIGELPYIVSIVFTFFVFILVINAFNLIDGIDGLAGSIAVIGCCNFGFFFVMNEYSLMSLVSFVLIGATLGFLRFNLSKSDKRKLFMGDSGSMFIGFLLAYLGICFLTMNGSANIPLPTSNGPIMLLAILSFPLMDTLRVFAIRASKKRSPFSPDRNHIHHRLLNIGLSHKQATLSIVTFNWVLIGTVFMIGNLNINLQLLICVGIGTLLYLFPFSKLAERLAGLIVLKESEDPIRLAKTNEETYRTEKEAYITSASNSVKSKTLTSLKVTDDGQEYSEEEKDSEFQKLMDKRTAIFKKTSILK